MALKTVVWVVFLGSILSGGARASEDPVKLGTGPDYPPFADEDMDGGGVAVELVSLVFRRLGRDAEMHRAPWNRLVYEASLLRLDAIFPYVVTPSREQKFLHSDPLFTLNVRLFAALDTTGDLVEGTLERPVRVCRPIGYALNEGLRPHLKHDYVEWVRPRSLESCFRMMARGRADLVPINEATGYYTIKQAFEEPPRFRGFEIYEEEATLHLLVPRSLAFAETLVEQFNRELAAVKASAEGQRLLESVERFGD